MNKTSYYFFISDLHLDFDQKQLNQSFSRFLKHLEVYLTKQNQVSLFILGDFHAKAVKDRVQPWFMSLAQQLDNLANKGLKIFFLVGNRDFLLGSNFTTAIGGRFLSENSVLTLNLEEGTFKVESFLTRQKKEENLLSTTAETNVESNTLNNKDSYNKEDLNSNPNELSILLCHGDNLCLSDISYLKFRKIIRSTPINFLSKVLPNKISNMIANGLRSKSKSKQAAEVANQPQKIYFDIDVNYLNELMTVTNSQLAIFGHIHKQRIIAFPSLATKETIKEINYLKFTGQGEEHYNFPLLKSLNHSYKNQEEQEEEEPSLASNSSLSRNYEKTSREESLEAVISGAEKFSNNFTPYQEVLSENDNGYLIISSPASQERICTENCFFSKEELFSTLSATNTLVTNSLANKEEISPPHLSPKFAISMADWWGEEATYLLLTNHPANSSLEFELRTLDLKD